MASLSPDRAPSPGPTVSRAERNAAIRVLFVAFAAWLLTNVDQSLFAYAIPQIRVEFDLDLTGIGLIISLSFVAGMIIPVLVGMATDRYGARRTLPACLAVSAVLVGLQGLLFEIYAFSSARIVSFGLSAALSPITNAMVLTAAPLRWRAIMVAVLQTAYPLGWLVSSLIVAPLIEELGWRQLFYVGFAIAPLGYVLVLLLPKGEAQAPAKPVAGAEPRKLPVSVLFERRYLARTLLCSAGVFFNAGAVAATSFYLPTFLVEVRGYSVGDSALVVGAGYGIGTFGYFGAALVATFLLTRRRTIILWNLIAAVVFAATVWLPQTFWQDFIAFGLMSMFYYGTSAILITLVLEAFPEHLRATAAAVCGTACVSASMATFPLLVAELVPQVGWQPTFTIIVVPALLVSAVAIFALRVREGGEADSA